MKFSFLLLLIIAVQKECNTSDDLTILDATSQGWMGGPAATRGTYYKIYFQLKDTTGIRFDSLWVNRKRMAVSLIKSAAPGDTMLLMANEYNGIRNPANQQEVFNSIDSPFPIETNASGLVGYLLNGQRKYMAIAQWRQLKPVFYQ